jgi:HEAT repeat protein
MRAWVLLPLILLAGEETAEDPTWTRALARAMRELGDERPDVRLRAATWLERRGPRAARAIPHLEKALHHDDDVRVRRKAGQALGGIGVAALPALRRGLGAKAHETRLGALAGFEAMGPPAEPARPDLEPLLAAKDLHVRAAAAGALFAMGSRTEA